MCGIFGISERRWTRKGRRSLEELARQSKERGRDTSGMVFVQDQIDVVKSFESIDSLIVRSDFETTYDRIDKLKPYIAFGHSRLVTNGAVFEKQYNQPIVRPNLVGVHNGIVSLSNLEGRKIDQNEYFENWDAISDSYVFYDALSHSSSSINDLFSALNCILGGLSGHLSIAFVHKDVPGIFLFTNTGSLYVTNNSDGFAFASEPIFLERAGLTDESSTNSIKQLDVEVLFYFDMHRHKLNRIGKMNTGKSFIPSQWDGMSGEWLDHPPSINVATTRRKLSRCKQCVLPETYPFITFDNKGICNYCRDYKSPGVVGEDVLLGILEKYRKGNGEPDCIVGLSGGRDSSYGLHKLVKDYGMSPIAYTYDWGLTTDISRFNQSRMCQALGVEHILRSANVEKKRRYVRQNIEAWLAKPHLGMVPLFMAGDKEFYEYGRKLRNERGIPLVIFCTGSTLEQRDFFVGYAGIRTSLYNVPRMFDYPMSVKIRLAAFYGMQYALNPRYINSSFFDSVKSFVVSFLKPENFLYLFQYIAWHEQEIDRILKDEYEWRSYTGYGENQWRMGDGQTALTNYIYHQCGGFSEYDNFRSLQIREGLIDRDAAIALVSEDNKPKFESIDYLCRTVGINMNYLLKRVQVIAEHMSS